MATYYPQRRRERERLPDISPSLIQALGTPAVTSDSILVFPSPPSLESLSAPNLSRGSTSASIPTSLIASVDGRSNPSHSRSNSSWEDVGHTATLQPLTRDRLAQLQSGLGWSSEDDVEVWDWSGGETPVSTASSFMRGRRPLPVVPPETSTEYESASSELHFSTTTGNDDPSDFGSLFLIALRSRETPGRASSESSAASDITKPSTGSYLFRFPFESLLGFFFDLDPETLELLGQHSIPTRPHPDKSTDPSSLFPSSNITGDALAESSDEERGILTRLSTADTHDAIQSLRKGLEALEDVPAPSHSLVAGALRAPFVIVKAVLRL